MILLFFFRASSAISVTLMPTTQHSASSTAFFSKSLANEMLKHSAVEWGSGKNTRAFSAFDARMKSVHQRVLCRQTSCCQSQLDTVSDNSLLHRWPGSFLDVLWVPPFDPQLSSWWVLGICPSGLSRRPRQQCADDKEGQVQVGAFVGNWWDGAYLGPNDDK